ncbi:MAG TPA: hypothetical protein VID72_02800 [Ktedonobacterales bacterium]
MSFIQVQQSLFTHRKTLRLARLLGEDRHTTIGRLIALWLWCLDHAPDGLLAADIDDETLADVMGWSEELGDPFDLVDALQRAGFLAYAEDGSEVKGVERWRVVGWADLCAHHALPDNGSANAPQDRAQVERAGDAAGDAADEED